MRADRCPLSRRGFLKGAGAAAGAALACPTIVPSSVLGAEAPSNRIAMGAIGVGRMGTDDLRSFLGFAQVQMLAVCDVDAKRADAARARVDASYAQRTGSAYKGCQAFGDYRELLARDDIEAVQIATPDHWHALPAIAAARAGKDIFIQKPLTHTVVEGRQLSDEVARYGRVLQVGSQQRSDTRFRFACELVRSGRIGRLQTVTVGFGRDSFLKPQPIMPVPEGLDYEFWLGPAPWAPYTENRVHPQQGFGRPGWLCISDYSCGMITGWGAHHMDIAHWGMGTEHGGPLEIEGEGVFDPGGLWDVHGAFRIEYLYPGGVKLTCADNGKVPQGVVFTGTEGKVLVRRGFLDAEPKSLLRETIGPGDVQLYRSNDHKGNFLQCLRTRGATIAPVEVGHRSNTACLLGEIAMRLGPGRRLRWDAQAERFPGDEDANRMLAKPMRGPWHL